MLTTRASRSVRAAALAGAVLIGALPVGSSGSAATAQQTAERSKAGSHGAAGIGDPYFPRDGNGGYDVAHYSVRDRYNQGSGLLEGSTAIKAAATERLSRFNLDLLLPVRSVEVSGRPATFVKRGLHEVVVTPPKPLAAGEAFTVLVQYAGYPGPISYQGERNWLADGRETVAMNQPHMAPWWFASNDHPLDKATFDIRITAPTDRTVVSNGELVRRSKGRDGLVTTHWRSREPMATYLAFFALGRYDVRSGVSGGLPYYVAVSKEIAPEPRHKAMRDLLRTPEIVDWLESQLGPYPFSSTGGLTTSLQPGFALENQTRPTYPVLGGDRLITQVHELAHQWFGDSVAVAGWRDIWLNEGLATFFEARWTETHGGDSAQSWLEKQYADLAGNPEFWKLRIDDPGAAHIFDTPVYLRGGMTAQALRTRIGDPAYFQLLQTWVSRRKGGNGTSADFEALAAQVSGQDLGPFFDAWLRAPVPPVHTAANGLP